MVSGLTPFGSSVAHSACRVGACLIFCSQQGLRSRCSLSPCLSYFAPIRGLENSARFRSQIPTLWRHLPPQSRYGAGAISLFAIKASFFYRELLISG